jgi:hypothetical protein
VGGAVGGGLRTAAASTAAPPHEFVSSIRAEAGHQGGNELTQSLLDEQQRMDAAAEDGGLAGGAEGVTAGIPLATHRPAGNEITATRQAGVATQHLRMHHATGRGRRPAVADAGMDACDERGSVGLATDSAAAYGAGGGGGGNGRGASGPMCVVCMEAGVQVVLVPCGHAAVCRRCSRRLTSCPLCRSAIHRRQRLFLGGPEP